MCAALLLSCDSLTSNGSVSLWLSLWSVCECLCGFLLGPVGSVSCGIALIANCLDCFTEKDWKVNDTESFIGVEVQFGRRGGVAPSTYTVL